VDLDFFSQEKFDVNSIETILEKEFGTGFLFEKTKITFAIFCEINHIKTDFVYYPHPLVSPIEINDGIRLYSNNDIAAMKINAILGRGVKKDFWDLAELMKEMDLTQIIEFHKQKYPTQMLLISIPAALTYFADAEESEDPVSLKGQTWSAIKNFMQEKIRGFLS
jgi:hypothetical protein